MSPLPARMIFKKEVVINSVAEFLGCWAVGGKATLSLSTVDGVTTIAFSNSLSGHPEAPLHPPLLLLDLVPGAGAAVTVAQPGGSVTANGLLATRRPRLVLHQPPLHLPQLQLLQPPLPLRAFGTSRGPTWTPSPSPPPRRRGKRWRLPPLLTTR